MSQQPSPQHTSFGFPNFTTFIPFPCEVQPYLRFVYESVLSSSWLMHRAGRRAGRSGFQGAEVQQGHAVETEDAMRAQKVQTVVTLRRGDDYATVSVEADVTLHPETVDVDNLRAWEAFDELPGVFPITRREMDMAERALVQEAEEALRERLEDMPERESLPYVMEVCQ